MIADFIKSIHIQEPRVMLSDFLLAGACIYCYINIKRKSTDILTEGFPKCWLRFFLFEGISFFIGGLAHGLYEYFGDLLHFLGWYASVAGVFFFTWGMIQASYGTESRKRTIILFVAILSAVASTVFNAFWIIVVYSFISMFEVIAFNVHSKMISFRKQQSKGILLGTALFVIAAAVHIFNVKLFGTASQITSHIIIAAGILLFGNGCLKTIYKHMRTQGIQMKKIQVKNKIIY